MVNEIKFDTGMYRSTNGYNIEIEGFPFFAESVDGDEFYNRREYSRLNIIGGTQFVNKGAYVPRSFSFTTHVRVEPNNPDVYNDIFREMMSKPCNVISPELGGMFDAVVVIKPKHSSPKYLELNVKITEIPTEKSNIFGEEIIIPEDKLQDVTEEDKEKKELVKEINPKPNDKPEVMGNLKKNVKEFLNDIKVKK